MSGLSVNSSSTPSYRGSASSPRAPRSTSRVARPERPQRDRQLRGVRVLRPARAACRRWTCAGAMPVAHAAIAFSLSGESSRATSFGSTRNARGTDGMSLAASLSVSASKDCRTTGICLSPISLFFRSASANSASGLIFALPVELRVLQLRVDARARLGPHQVDRFLERQQPRAGELLVEPRARVEPLELGEREVVDVPVLAGLRPLLRLDEPVGEHLFDVGRAFEREVVDAHQHAVLADREVLLDVVGALFHRELVGVDGVLGCVRGRAAVGDEDLLRRGRLSATAAAAGKNDIGGRAGWKPRRMSDGRRARLSAPPEAQGTARRPLAASRCRRRELRTTASLPTATDARPTST